MHVPLAARHRRQGVGRFDLGPGLSKLGKLGKLGELRRACGCVVAGAPRFSPSGLVAIERLEVGDMVLAYDPETDKVVPPTGPLRHDDRAQAELFVVFRAADGETRHFEASDDHPWLNVAKEWRNHRGSGNLKSD